MDENTYRTLWPSGFIEDDIENVDLLLSIDFFKNYKIVFDFNALVMWIEYPPFQPLKNVTFTHLQTRKNVKISCFQPLKNVKSKTWNVLSSKN